MKRIGLLSDTHGYLERSVFKHFANCDEIWHAGDIGDVSVIHQLKKFKPLKAVHGNIDGADVRACCPEDFRFQCERMDVWITHIGGYPGRYSPRILPQMKTNPPKLFICGHSHILKVIYDKRFELLHINPGAAGNSGFHKVKTMVRFSIDGSQVKDLEIIEIKRKSLFVNKGI